jgi:threonine synthase
MNYNSTQNAAEVVSAAQAIAQGISKDGGLFVPQSFPQYDEATLRALLKED